LGGMGEAEEVDGGGDAGEGRGEGVVDLLHHPVHLPLH
jgi:hypothetical protein